MDKSYRPALLAIHPWHSFSAASRYAASGFCRVPVGLRPHAEALPWRAIVSIARLAACSVSAHGIEAAGLLPLCPPAGMACCCCDGRFGSCRRSRVASVESNAACHCQSSRHAPCVARLRAAKASCWGRGSAKRLCANGGGARLSPYRRLPRARRDGCLSGY